MSTVYTFNNKVLKNTSNDKWLAKKGGPLFDEVTIGNQTWLSKNLAIDDGLGGIASVTVNYGQGNVTEYFYTWDAAIRVAETVQGWHLPTKDEWDTLISTVGGGNAGDGAARSDDANLGFGAEADSDKQSHSHQKNGFQMFHRMWLVFIKIE